MNKTEPVIQADTTPFNRGGSVQYISGSGENLRSVAIRHNVTSITVGCQQLSVSRDSDGISLSLGIHQNATVSYDDWQSILAALNGV